MKRSFLVIFILVLIGNLNAQILNPVKWSFSAKKIADKTYEIHLIALVDDTWHIYSQDAGEGPVPTSFKFTPNPLLALQGKVKEVGALKKSYDPNFKSELKYYEQKVDFVQKIKSKSSATTVIKGTVSFMVCNDRQCLPPKDIPFSINVGQK